MPGSLSNEDEGQDDMDFEDDMPGEGKGGGEAGCPSHYFAPLRLECGEKGLSCVPETKEEEEGWGTISRVMLLFFARPHYLPGGHGSLFACGRFPSLNLGLIKALRSVSQGLFYLPLNCMRVRQRHGFILQISVKRDPTLLQRA